MRRYCLLGLVFAIAWCGPLTFVRGQHQRRDAGTALGKDTVQGAESKKEKKGKKKKPDDNVKTALTPPDPRESVITREVMFGKTTPVREKL